MSKAIILQSGREKSLKRRHPWIFSGAVRSVTGEPLPGETVEVRSAGGELLAHAAYSPQSQLMGRIWSFNPTESIDRTFFENRIKRAIALRDSLNLNQPEGGCRLLASEADGLPGIIADRYADFIVVQILSAGAEFHKTELAEILLAQTGCRGVYERSDVSVRAYEGLEERSGMLLGEEPPAEIVIDENGLKLAVDIRHGHKTGFYLDQRENRAEVMKLVQGKSVLNCFSYTGAFSAAALKAGASSVTNVDSSAPALTLAKRNLELNDLPQDSCEQITADVFTQLRKFRDQNRKFDVVILDPPKFIDGKGALVRGCRAYQDIARLGMLLLNPGGTLVTFSCSGLMTPELFQKITADAALDANVNGRIIRRLAQSADHPTALNTPETFYLKGFVVKI